MTTLIKRIEAAQGPDRVADELILLAIGWTFERSPKLGERATWIDPTGVKTAHRQGDGWFKPTSSIDAALTLVPDGLYPAIDFVTKRVWLRTAEGFDPPNGPAHGFAQTVQNSIIASALRARKAKP